MSFAERAPVLWVGGSENRAPALNEVLGEFNFEISFSEPSGNFAEHFQQRDYAFVLLSLEAMPQEAIRVIRAIRLIKNMEDLPVILWVNDDASLTQLLQTGNLGVLDILRPPIVPQMVQAKLTFLKEVHDQKIRMHRRMEESSAEARDYRLRLEQSHEKFRKHNQALSDLNKNRAVIEGDLPAALKEVSEITAAILDCDRITVWVYSESHDALQCILQFENGLLKECHRQELTRKEFHHYLNALDQERTVAVADVQTDERGADFRDLQKTGASIAAFLASSFKTDGRRTGVLRGDQAERTRQWTLEEEIFIASVADIISRAIESSERRRSEEALRESEEKLRMILDHALDYAFLLLDPGGNITECSRGGELILGYKEWEMVGKNTSMIFTEEDRANGMHEKEMQTALAKGKSIDERWHLKKDGSKFWGSGFLVALRDSTGQHKGFAKIMRDGTDRKRADEQTLNLNQELERRVDERTLALQQANAQLEAFCYTVAHDLRAPLRSMEGFARILIMDLADRLTPDGTLYLERIEASARRMDMLIRDLLNYSRVGRIELPEEDVDLAAVIQSVFADIESEIEAREAEVLVQHPLPHVCGHKATLEHVLMNLLTNALKFGRPGVRVSISISTERRDDWIRVWVEDNGIGIPPEYRDKIFRIFERLDVSERYPGTGVGLAIVSKAIERLGGRTGVESEIGKGSRFWFELKEA